MAVPLLRAVLVSTLLLLLPMIVLVVIHRRHLGRKKKSIVIIVLGDIAQSPRMMRHALSFSDHKWDVSILAYVGSTPPKSLAEHPHIQLVHLNEFPDWITARLPRILFVLVIGPLKALYLSVSLASKLILQANRCSFIMVQNPPAIPTLPIVQLLKLILGSKLIIDWHNTAYSILALKLGSDQHFMVRLLKWTESQFGKFASLHLFVTEAEKVSLTEAWNLQGRKKVFYDRPPKSFCRLTIPEIHSFILHSPLHSDLILNEIFATGPSSPSETIITYQGPQTTDAKFKPDRAALLVSSTSWTIDEDFNVLIDGLSIYAKSKKENTSLPKIICLITGKGPLKEYYKGIISQRSKAEGWAKIGICCQSIWFEDPEDYRKLLGSADLGISLHQSSSGLDLPMKVVDMFGCGLPVCARNFNCISELVKHGQNGLVFDSAVELASLMQELLIGSNEQQKLLDLESITSRLADLRRGIQTAIYGSSKGNISDGTTDQTQHSINQWSCWEDHWEKHVLKSLESI